MSILNISTRQKTHWSLLTWKHSFWQSTVFFRDYFHALFLLLPEGTKAPKPRQLQKATKKSAQNLYVLGYCLQLWGTAPKMNPTKHSHWAELAEKESSSFSQSGAITLCLEKAFCIPTNEIKILHVQSCSELIFCLHHAMDSVCPYHERQGSLVWELLVTAKIRFPYGI